MRSSITFALAAAATLGAAPALAQEKAPFTGPRADIMLGYDHLGGNNGNPDADGFDYVGNIGYDAQLGSVIVGIEGEAGGSTAKKSFFDGSGDRLRLKADRDLYIGARAGIAVRPTTLLYVKGGYTNQRIKEELTLGEGGGVFDTHATLDGWRVGAGVEQKFSMFGPGGYVKAEYRYSNYGNANFQGQNSDVDYDRHQVLAGVGVRF